MARLGLVLILSLAIFESSGFAREVHPLPELEKVSRCSQSFRKVYERAYQVVTGFRPQARVPMPTSPRPETALKEYADKQTDLFGIYKVYAGLHGGKRFGVRTQGVWYDPRKKFKKGEGDVVVDLRLYPELLGPREARFFGFQIVSKDEVTLPDVDELNSAIQAFNTGLALGGSRRIELTFVLQKSSFSSLKTYKTGAVRKRKIPISQVGRQFYHDTNGHGLEGFIVNNELLDLIDRRDRVWTAYMESRAAHPALSGLIQEQDVQFDQEVSDYIDKMSNLVGSYQSYESKLKLEAGNREAIMSKFNTQGDHPYLRLFSDGFRGIFDTGSFPGTTVNWFPIFTQSAADYFNGIIKNTEVQRDFADFLKNYERTHPEDLKPLSFDFAKELKTVEDARKYSNQKWEEVLRQSPLSKPFMERLDRLRQLVSKP